MQASRAPLCEIDGCDQIFSSNWRGSSGPVRLWTTINWAFADANAHHAGAALVQGKKIWSQPSIWRSKGRPTCMNPRPWAIAGRRGGSMPPRRPISQKRGRLPQRAAICLSMGHFMRPERMRCQSPQQPSAMPRGQTYGRPPSQSKEHPEMMGWRSPRAEPSPNSPRPDPSQSPRCPCPHIRPRLRAPQLRA